MKMRRGRSGKVLYDMLRNLDCILTVIGSSNNGRPNSYDQIGILNRSLSGKVRNVSGKGKRKTRNQAGNFKMLQIRDNVVRFV